MESKNALVTYNEIIECEGMGDGEQNAVEKAFDSMRMQVKQKISDSIISISTDKVECLELRDESYEEAFLFILFKRVRKQVYVKLKVYLTIKYLNLKGGKEC